MSNIALYAITVSQHQTEKIVVRLISEGFANNRLSILFSENSTTINFADSENMKAAEIAFLEQCTSEPSGGPGSIVSFNGGSYPPRSPLIDLSGEVFAKATAGSIATALTEMGVPEREAQSFESKVAKGNILISIYAKSRGEVSLAKQILRDHDACEICVARVSDSGVHQYKIASRRNTD